MYCITKLDIPICLGRLQNWYALSLRVDYCCLGLSLVQKLINEIDISKSSAMGNLSTRLLRDAFACMIFKLAYLYNNCLETSTFPAKWGIGIVTPIPKTQTKSKEAKYWRPITQICLPGKILERIVHRQLNEYLETNNLLFSNQHGFRSNKSTSTAVFNTLKNLFENWNINLDSTCVYIDFARAFHSIDHNIFIRKLHLYGLDGACIEFFQSYMNSRAQCTKIGDYVSGEAKLRCGTAQGSILGPLFFILYVNDIFSYVTYKHGLTMYADDTLLIQQGITIDSSIEACQTTMNEVSTWCNLNKLTVNIGKTKTMTIKPGS